MTEDQELLDRFAIAAMPVIAARDKWISADDLGSRSYAAAIEMMKARDRICTTAKPAEMDPGPYPKIDTEGAST